MSLETAADDLQYEALIVGVEHIITSKPISETYSPSNSSRGFLTNIERVEYARIVSSAFNETLKARGLLQIGDPSNFIEISEKDIKVSPEEVIEAISRRVSSQVRESISLSPKAKDLFTSDTIPKMISRASEFAESTVEYVRAVRSGEIEESQVSLNSYTNFITPEESSGVTEETATLPLGSESGTLPESTRVTPATEVEITPVDTTSTEAGIEVESIIEDRVPILETPLVAHSSEDIIDSLKESSSWDVGNMVGAERLKNSIVRSLEDFPEDYGTPFVDELKDLIESSYLGIYNETDGTINVEQLTNVILGNQEPNDNYEIGESLGSLSPITLAQTLTSSAENTFDHFGNSIDETVTAGRNYVEKLVMKEIMETGFMTKVTDSLTWVNNLDNSLEDITIDFINSLWGLEESYLDTPTCSVHTWNIISGYLRESVIGEIPKCTVRTSTSRTPDEISAPLQFSDFASFVFRDEAFWSISITPYKIKSHTYPPALSCDTGITEATTNSARMCKTIQRYSLQSSRTNQSSMTLTSGVSIPYTSSISKPSKVEISFPESVTMEWDTFRRTYIDYCVSPSGGVKGYRLCTYQIEISLYDYRWSEIPNKKLTLLGVPIIDISYQGQSTASYDAQSLSFDIVGEL